MGEGTPRLPCALYGRRQQLAAKEIGPAVFRCELPQRADARLRRRWIEIAVLAAGYSDAAVQRCPSSAWADVAP